MNLELVLLNLWQNINIPKGQKPLNPQLHQCEKALTSPSVNLRSLYNGAEISSAYSDFINQTFLALWFPVLEYLTNENICLDRAYALYLFAL